MYRQLLEDGGLVLTAIPEVADLLDRWLPRAAPPARVPDRAAGRIHIGQSARPMAVEDRPDPAIEVFALRAWVEQPERVILRTRTGTLAGVVDLNAREARIEIAPGDRPAALPHDIFCTLTVAAAFLLSRQHKLLMHAAAFVAPDGAAWLLVGDSHSGKSSTCANVIRMGWAFLADDQVVIGVGADGSLEVEGWARDFNIDEGFEKGTSTGIRQAVAPDRLGAGVWQRSARLGGLLFPTVNAQEPTSLGPLSEAATLQQLIRQSPWLLADPVAAPTILKLLQTMATLPRYRLSLGTDTYQDPTELVAVLRTALDFSDISIRLDPPHR